MVEKGFVVDIREQSEASERVQTKQGHEEKGGKKGRGKQTKRGALNQEAKKWAKRACGQKWLVYLVKRNLGEGKGSPRAGEV